MPDADPLAAVLDEFRGLGGFAYPGEWDAAGPRLLAAVDAVLKLAADAEPVDRDYGGEPIWWTLTPDEIRSAVLAGLTGEAGSHG